VKQQCPSFSTAKRAVEMLHNISDVESGMLSQSDGDSVSSEHLEDKS